MPLSSSPESPPEGSGHDSETEDSQDTAGPEKETTEISGLDTSEEKPYDPQNGGSEIKLSELDIDEETKRKINELRSDEPEDESQNATD